MRKETTTAANTESNEQSTNLISSEVIPDNSESELEFNDIVALFYKKKKEIKDAVVNTNEISSIKVVVK